MKRLFFNRQNDKRGVSHIGVTVCFIIHDGTGRVLLQKRSRHCRDEQGKWDVGGGAVELGERLEDAVRREVREELAAEPRAINFLAAGDAHRSVNGKPTHWVWLLYAVQVRPSEVKMNDPRKIDEIGWFTSDHLPTPLHSMFPRALQAAQKHNLII